MVVQAVVVLDMAAVVAFKCSGSGSGSGSNIAAAAASLQIILPLLPLPTRVTAAASAVIVVLVKTLRGNFRWSLPMEALSPKPKGSACEACCWPS